MSTAKAFAKGSECPLLKSGLLRLYSMRFCPYAERARLVLSFHNVPYEIVNINMTNKPEWFLKKSPMGTVPVLEKDGKILHESTICSEYLDEVYGNKQLTSTDPYKKAQQKMMTERFSKFIGLYYAILRTKNKDDLKEFPGRIEEALKPFENSLHEKFFGGDALGLLDLFIWPWFERFPVLQQNFGIEILKKGGSFPKLSAWVAAMEELPAVKACIVPLVHQVEFIKQYSNPDIPFPDYDLGLN